MRDGGNAEGKLMIATPRLVIRPRRAGDEIAAQALASNPAIAPNLCATIPVEDGAAMVICERIDGRLVGGAALGRTGLGTGTELALWVGEPDWDRGFATEAAHGLIDHAFADCDTPALWCSNRVTNPRARRVIEKCGFQYRGAGMVSLPGRGAFPIERFALDRRTWSSLKAWGASIGSAGDATRETAA